MNLKKSIKLHAFLAQAGIGSRRTCESYITQGKVRVNGKIATLGQRIDPTTDEVLFNENLVESSTEYVYFLVNKPVGYVSTSSDELGRQTVLSLLPSEITGQYRLYPVGRLDIESEGLLLLTNDGPATQKLTHPSFGVHKTYEVLLDRVPTTAALKHLRSGVRLKDGFTDAIDVIELDREPVGCWLSLTLAEGRNRQVRRMMERIGYETMRLIRTQFGPWSIELFGGDELETQDPPAFIQLDQAEVVEFLKSLAT